MAAEFGHATNRAYMDQDGNFHLNGASFWATETADVGGTLANLPAIVAHAPVTTYTQTYATTSSTVPAATTTGPGPLVLTSTNIAAKTASLTLSDAINTNAGTVATSLDQAQKDLGTQINTLRTELAAAVADLLALKKVVNSLIDDLQAMGLAL